LSRSKRPKSTASYDRTVACCLHVGRNKDDWIDSVKNMDIRWKSDTPAGTEYTVRQAWHMHMNFRFLFIWTKLDVVLWIMAILGMSYTEGCLLLFLLLQSFLVYGRVSRYAMEWEVIEKFCALHIAGVLVGFDRLG
jgi:hypothetical protein